VVTNIDPEHLDFYGTFEAERRAFHTFIANTPFYGVAILCLDHPEVQALVAQVPDRKIVTYGMSPQADVRAVALRLNGAGARFDAVITDRDGGVETIADLHLPLVGAHNVQNSLAAVAVGHEMGLSRDVMRRALAGLRGVKRRFTKTGEAAGLTVIDDYGHHPVEIAAVLRAARSATSGGVVAVVQPHRYTRLHNLFEEFCTCFNDADAVIVAEVYAAGEAPIEGVDRDALVAGLRAHGHRKVISLGSPGELAQLVHETARPGDLVVCLGAGSITNWAHALPQELERFRGQAPQVQVGGLR
jgi:UDP-N-acetylmuramate--alanine ligase